MIRPILDRELEIGKSVYLYYYSDKKTFLIDGKITDMDTKYVYVEGKNKKCSFGKCTRKFAQEVIFIDDETISLFDTGEYEKL